MLFRLTINGKVYENDNIAAISTSRQLCGDDDFSIGNCCAEILKANLRLTTPLSGLTDVLFYVSENGTSFVQRGAYILIKSRTNYETGFTAIECYDRMIKFDTKITSWQNITLPVNTRTLLNALCADAGVTIDNISDVANIQTSYFNNKISTREVLGYIASASGGNFIMTHSGNLRLVKLNNNAASAKFSNVGFEQINVKKTYSKVTIVADEQTEYTAGNNTGAELIVYNPMTLPNYAPTLLAMINGFAYTPYRADGAYIPFNALLGTRYNILGLDNALLLRIDMKYDQGGVRANIAAPGQAQADEVYPYTDSTARKLQQKVGIGVSYYGTTIDYQNGLTIERSDKLAKTVLNSDVFTMQTGNGSGTYTNALYFDVPSRTYMFTGNLIIKSTADMSNGTIKLPNDGGISADGTITTKGEIHADGNIETKSKIVANGLEITGEITAKSNITADGDITAKGKIKAGNGAEITGTLTASGDITTQGKITTTSITATGDITTSGTITGKIKAIGDFTTDGKITAGGDLAVNGNITATGDITANGTITGKLKAVGDFTTDGKITAGGDVATTGNITAGGDITTTGTVNADKIIVGGTGVITVNSIKTNCLTVSASAFGIGTASSSIQSLSSSGYPDEPLAGKIVDALKAYGLLK